MLTRLALVVAFRGRGFRWPFRESDVLEVWAHDHLLAEMPATFVLELVRQHLTTVVLDAQLRGYVSPIPVALTRLGASVPNPVMARDLRPGLRQGDGRRLRGR